MMNWKRAPKTNERQCYYHFRCLCFDSPSRFVLMVSQPLALYCTHIHKHSMSQLICTNIVQIVTMFITIYYPVSLTMRFLSGVVLGTASIQFTLVSVLYFLSPLLSQGQCQNEKLTNFSSLLKCFWMETEPQSQIGYICIIVYMCFTCAKDKFQF